MGSQVPVAAPRLTPDRVEARYGIRPDQIPDFIGLKGDTSDNIPGIPGYWMDCGNDTQIHIMGCDGMSRYAKGPKQDPTTLHVALAVPDVQEAKRELDRMGVKYWSIVSVVGPQLEQLFMDDPHGNLIELHEAGTCRCKKTVRKNAAATPSMAG